MFQLKITITQMAFFKPDHKLIMKRSENCLRASTKVLKALQHILMKMRRVG